MFSLLSTAKIRFCLLTFRPSYADPIAIRSARCWDQQRFCLQNERMSIKVLRSTELDLSLHESKATRPSSLVVLHHNAINDFSIAAEVSLQAVLGCFPAQAADEKFPGCHNHGSGEGGKGKKRENKLIKKTILSSNEKIVTSSKKMNVRDSIFEK